MARVRVRWFMGFSSSVGQGPVRASDRGTRETADRMQDLSN
jgi:hypothetical protein